MAAGEKETRLQPRSRLTQEAAAKTILVVDDDRIIRDICARALADYRTVQATSGAEALQLLAAADVDLVLTDVMMPQMNGLDLLKAIKEQDPNQAVVVMTGFTDKEVILRALQADADDFISKPIHLLQLKTTVQKVLERKALREELLQLRRLDRLKTDFLGLVSHKLKTPVTVISLFIQNLAQGIGDPQEPAFRRSLALILEETDYLGALIQDLLNYSQIILQDGPPALRAENPFAIARTAAMERQVAAEQRGVRLESTLPEEAPAIPLDGQRYRFCLLALLDNAIKFTPAGGTVEVTGSVGADTVQVIIRDSGIGIPREEMPKIFEKFYQVDPNHSGQVRGFGLGLYYARKFVHMHGGTLHLESAPGKGTSAFLSLPRPR